MNVLVFDIETVPDVKTGRRLYDLSPEVVESDVIQRMQALALEQTGSAFVRQHLQKIISISAVYRQGEQLKIWSFGNENATEAMLIQRFFAGIDKLTPTLVSWNGSGFDLPVLHYRALHHSIVGQRYWEMGQIESDFKFNNYQNRYHSRHLDIMDILASYQSRAFAKLDEIAVLLGLPGKMVMKGEEVLEYYLQGKLAQINAYCEIDVVNTYLIFLRLQLIRGILTQDGYEHEINLMKKTLSQSPLHLQEFLNEWNQDVKEIS